MKKQRVGSKIRKGDVHRAVLIRSKGSKRNKYPIEFEDNSVVLVKDIEELIPIGNRFKGPISNEFKKKQGGQKLVLLAKSIV